VKERRLAGDAYLESDYVLSNELGESYHPDTASQWFNDAVMASGLPRIRLHDSRHTAASLMVEAGKPTRVVGDLLAHARR
jgi:integrase